LRMEVVSHKPLTILDGAHNRDKIRSTTETMTTLLPLFGIRNLHLIISFSGDKDVFGMLKQLLSLQPTNISITRNSVNPFRKVADMDLIRTHIRRTLPKCKVEIFLDPKDAYEYTKRIAKPHDCILATGSIFMSGELRGRLLG
nr:hypothetical protein [Candidatus Magasanikbacteria bacterium]